MATTTTVAAIRAQLVAVLEALPPAGFRQPFRHVANRKAPLAETAQNTTAWFRRFMVTAGDPTRAELQDPSAKRRTEAWEVRVMYPSKHGLGGTLGVEGIEDLIRADQSQIEDAIYTAANWRPEVRHMTPASPSIEEGEDGFVSVIPFTVEYLQSQSI